MSRILAIGDLHTKNWIIDEVEKIAQHYDHVVFCGDYADEWGCHPADSLATWRYLRMFMQHNENIKAVLGNHDYAYLHPEIAGRSSGYNQMTQILLNAPENKPLKQWLLSLPVVLEIEGVTFSHAGVTEEWNGQYDVNSLWSDVSPIWARPKHLGGYVTYKNIPQVIGHNASKTCNPVAPTVWCIDTFSNYSDGAAIGDHTVLEIVDGQFNMKKLTEIQNEHNSNTTSVESELS